MSVSEAMRRTRYFFSAESSRPSTQGNKRVVIKEGLPTVNVVTSIDRSPTDVRSLRTALRDGDVATNRPPLPSGVVEKILDSAEYWCCVRQECSEPFDAFSDLDCRIFKFGPLPGKPKKLEFFITSHDQGWSSYPEEQGLWTSWTFGELDVKSGTDGASKLENRMQMFRNKHAVRDWQDYGVHLSLDQDIPCTVEKGDTLELYLRAMFPLWRIFVQRAKMAVHYDAP